MKILLVTDSYPPEIRSASHLMLELSEELNSRDHRVTVITTWPKYNLEKPLESIDFEEKQIQNGIQIIRVKTLPHHNVNFFLRGISQLIMPFQFKPIYKGFDFFIRITYKLIIIYIAKYNW